MIYAEKRREGGDVGNYYTLRYLVWNGELLGSYGVHFGEREFENFGFGPTKQRPRDPEGTGFAYGASRDYHRLATEAEIANHKEWEAFRALPEAEQHKLYDADKEPAYGYSVDTCCYLDNRPSICDGSGLVEITLDDKEAFAIAAMMADLPDYQEV